MNDTKVSLDIFTREAILTFAHSMVAFEKEWRTLHLKDPIAHPVQMERSKWNQKYREFMEKG